MDGQVEKKKKMNITAVRLILCKLSVHIANKRMVAKSSAPIFHLSFNFNVVTIHKSKLVTASVYGFSSNIDTKARPYAINTRFCTFIDAIDSHWDVCDMKNAIAWLSWHRSKCCNIKWRTHHCYRIKLLNFGINLSELQRQRRKKRSKTTLICVMSKFPNRIQL